MQGSKKTAIQALRESYDECNLDIPFELVKKIFELEFDAQYSGQAPERTASIRRQVAEYVRELLDGGDGE